MLPLSAFARVVRRTDTEKESLPAQQCAKYLRKVQTARQGGARAVTQIRGQGVINHCRVGLPQATKVPPVGHFAQQV